MNNTFIDRMFDAVDNCSNLDWIMRQIRENKDKISKDEIIKIVDYYLSHK